VGREGTKKACIILFPKGLNRMKRWLKKHSPQWVISILLSLYGLIGLIYLPKFLAQFWSFARMSKARKDFKPPSSGDLFPKLGEATAQTGFDHHYIYHPAWAARIVAKTKPPVHVDISSTLHFCSMLSAFVPVKFYDYRPAKLELDNLESGRADLTKMPFLDNSIASLSCMHTVEHVGLGRYGDPLDANGDLKAVAELKRVTARGGNLLFVVPTGRPKVMFNAHRIYSYRQIINYFDGFVLKNFALVTDDGQGRDFIENASEQEANRQIYGCGCYWFQKL
jgi:SAM-dependent methyltransferase